MTPPKSSHALFRHKPTSDGAVVLVYALSVHRGDEPSEKLFDEVEGFLASHPTFIDEWRAATGDSIEAKAMTALTRRYLYQTESGS